MDNDIRYDKFSMFWDITGFLRKGNGKRKRKERGKEKGNGKGKGREEWFLVLPVKTEEVTMANLGSHLANRRNPQILLWWLGNRGAAAGLFNARSGQNGALQTLCILSVGLTTLHEFWRPDKHTH